MACERSGAQRTGLPDCHLSDDVAGRQLHCRAARIGQLDNDRALEQDPKPRPWLALSNDLLPLREADDGEIVGEYPHFVLAEHSKDWCRRSHAHEQLKRCVLADLRLEATIYLCRLQLR